MLRETLLKATARRIQPVQVPQDFRDADLAGQTLYVRSMSAAERGRFESQFLSDKTRRTDVARTAEVRQRLMIATCCDENGQLLFHDNDLEALGNLDAAIAELLADAAQKLNSFADSDVAALAKN
jgi:hypothetical protein